MPLETYKSQARRLQDFLSSNPSRAARLAEAKHSVCLEAVAAIHGARNWNTLQARPAAAEPCATSERPVLRHTFESPEGAEEDCWDTPAPETTGRARVVPSRGAFPEDTPISPARDLGPAFGGSQPGQAQYRGEPAGPDKGFGIAADIVAALASGYVVSVLASGKSYSHLAEAFQGVSLTPEEARHSARLTHAPLAVLRFEVWKFSNLVLTGDSSWRRDAWARVIPCLTPRVGKGFALVVEDAAQWAETMGDDLHLLVAWLAYARSRGTLVVLVGQTPEAALPFRDALTPSP